MEQRVDLAGQIWFDFASPQVWTFYRFARAAARAGVAVTLDWQPYPADGQDLAMSAFASLTQPLDRGKFLHAMLGLVHIEGQSPNDAATVDGAIHAAGVDASRTVDITVLETKRSQALALGVVSTPTLYRHGTPLHVVLTAAALSSHHRETVRTIVEATDNDGIWELRKP